MKPDIILRVLYNGVTTDLVVDNQVPLRLDMSAVESQQLGKFFGVGSQTFNIPGGQEANIFFNHAYDIAVDDVPAMYNTIPCWVLLNGETVLTGALQLQEVITSEDGFVTYSVSVVDKTIQFEQALSSKLIRNADWSAYDHTLSFENITGSWDNNLLSGSIYYPLVDYGNQADKYETLSSNPLFQLTPISGAAFSGGYIGHISSPVKMHQWQPAIRLKDTLDVIFDQVGFTYTGSFTETADFNNLYILNKPNEGLGVGSGEDVLFKAQMLSNQTVDGIDSINQVNTEIISMSLEVFDDSGNYDPLTYTYTTPELGDYVFNLSMNFTNPATELCDVTVKLNLYSTIGGGTVQASSSIDLTYQDDDFQTLNLTFGYGFSSGVELLAQTVLIYNGGGGSSNDMTILNTSTSFFSLTSGPVTYDGVTVDMSQQWQADTKSLDIIRGLLQQFNVVMIPDATDSSVIRIEQFDDWLRQGEIKDWTDKYNTAKRISINHTIDELSKEILLKNVDDNDRFSKLTQESLPNYQYGTLRLLADNNISQGTKKIGEFFAPVVLGGAINFDIIPGATQFDGNYPINLDTTFLIPHLYKFENSKQVAYSFKPRLGYKVQGQIPSGQSYYIESGSSQVQFTNTYHTIANVSSLPVVSGSSNDLHFNNTYSSFTNADLNLNEGVSSFENYWKTYLDSLYWEGSKKVTMDLYFEPYEYQDIKLNDRILIKNQAYRINKISGFNISERDVVTVELIKLYPKYWQLGTGTVTPTPTPTPTGGLPTPTPTPTATPSTPTPTPTPSATTGGPTPTPSPEYNSYVAERNDGGALSWVGPYPGTFGTTNDSVFVNDGSGQCWTLGSPVTNAAVYTMTAACSTPTPSPTPTPTPQPCQSILLEGPVGTADFTCAGGTTYYMDSTDFCTATQLYRLSDCTRLALEGWYHDFSQTKHRYWSGTAFTTSCELTDCP